MALRLAEIEPREYEFCITPTGRELPEMVDHWKRIEDLIQHPLTRIPCPSLVELIVKFHALPNWRMRWCTRLIKIEPFMAYALAAKPAVCYVGIRADESGDREGTDWKDETEASQDFPLVRWGWGLNKVVEYLNCKGVVIPKRTDCDWCFWQRLIEWYELWKNYPEQWAEGEAIEHFSGHTFRSAGRDTWPASMAGLRKEFESGRIPKDTRNGQRDAMCAWCAR